MQLLTQVYLVFFLLATSLCLHAASDKIDFRELNLESAKKISQKEGKLIFISFTASWCSACKLIDQSLFQDEEIISLVNESFVAVKANIESFEGVELNQNYNATYLPTMIFAAQSGNEFQRFKGVPSRKDLIQALKKYQTISVFEKAKLKDKKSSLPSLEITKKTILKKEPGNIHLETKDNKTAGNKFILQLGAFSDKENALNFLHELQKSKVPDATLIDEIVLSKRLFKVVIQYFDRRESAQIRLNGLINEGFEAYIRKI